MKILFICASLEYGKDGVGDYTRRLATSLIKKGHSCNVLALMDKFISVPNVEEQTCDGIKISVFRLPYKGGLKGNSEKAKIWVRNLKPDWISIQYVNFGFSKRGLPFGIEKYFLKISGTAKIHIMLHELWCGMLNDSSIKNRVLGILQKWHLRFVLNRLSPHSIFTNIDYYQEHLIKFGLKVDVVPIFSNIPVDTFPSDKEWGEFLIKLGLNSIMDNTDKYFTLGFFGVTHDVLGLKKLLDDFFNYASSIKRKVIVVVIGKGGGVDLQSFIKFPHLLFKTGELPERFLNKMLFQCDYGVMTTSAIGLNKSGSAIAWLERGKHLLISSLDLFYDSSTMIEMGILQITDLLATNVILNDKAKKPENDRLATVTHRYVSIFNGSN